MVLMEFGNISKILVYTAAIYLVVLAYGSSFIFSNIAFGGLTQDFWLIFAIITLPLLPLLAYVLRSRSAFLRDKGGILKWIFIILAAIAAIFVAFFIVPISY